MDDAVLGSISEAEASQGLLALARRPVFTEEALLRGRPLLLVAVGIQNPGNVGALLRAAEAAGASGAYMAGGCADTFSWKALRGSMGSAFRLPHLRRPGARETLLRLKERGVASVAAVSSGGTPYDQVDLARPVALVVGNEGAGLGEDLLEAVSARASIPMRGGVESLNVAVAAGVLLFEAARQRRR
jgi:TrmH family RNA methyltransferase